MENVDLATEAGRVWHVLHVRPRCEKKMVQYCAGRSLDSYLPLRAVNKVYQRRRVRTEIPVFPGYVFAAYRREERPAVLQSNLVANELSVADPAHFLHELDQIRLALAVDETLGACEAFVAGRRVRIVNGSFAGIEGIVQSVRPDARVVLNVEMIGQGVAVDVETDFLEALDD